MLEKLFVTAPPSKGRAAINTTPMAMAISPYSIAVAPESSLRNRAMLMAYLRTRARL
jgi:hypothetical protein